MAELVTVVVDTREQEPYSFPPRRFVIERRALPAGGAFPRAPVRRRVSAALPSEVPGFMPTATTEHTRIRGEVERVFFSSANFSAGRFITERGDRIQFAGNVVVQEKQPLVLHGKFVRHPKYGFQFEVTSMEFDRQMDARGLANYL